MNLTIHQVFKPEETPEDSYLDHGPAILTTKDGYILSFLPGTKITRSLIQKAKQAQMRSNGTKV